MSNVLKPFSERLVARHFRLCSGYNLPCQPGAAGSIPGFSSLLDETKPLPLHHMILAVRRMLNTQTHTQKVNPMPTPFSPIPILSALKLYTAPFSPTLAVFCVLLSYQGNYFPL